MIPISFSSPEINRWILDRCVQQISRVIARQNRAREYVVAKAAKRGAITNIHKEDREEIFTKRVMRSHVSIENIPKGSDKAQKTPKEVATPFPP